MKILIKNLIKINSKKMSNRSVAAEEKLRKKCKKCKYTIISEYVNTSTRIELECSKGHRFDCYPPEITRDKARECAKCRDCFDENIASLKKLLKVHKATSSEYSVPSAKLVLTCKENHSFKYSFNELMAGKWCKQCKLKTSTKEVVIRKVGNNYVICKESEGERRMNQYLTSKKIKFEREYEVRIPDLVRYDFLLPKKKILLEYDGIQHFSKSAYFGDDEAKFKKRQLKDALKTSWALNNGFRLIRIAYTSLEQLETFLEAALKKKEKLIVSNSEMYQYLK